MSLPGQRGRLGITRSRLPEGRALGQRQEPGKHAARLGIRSRGYPAEAAATRSWNPPRLSGVAYRARTYARRKGLAGGCRHRCPRLSTLPECALYRRVWALRWRESTLSARCRCRHRGTVGTPGGSLAEKEHEGADVTITTGELWTDPKFHGPSKIAGETRFVIDIRSVSDATMREMADEARRAAQTLGEKYRVKFELGPTTDSLAAMMDPRLRSAFANALPEPFEMPSGAGHDAVMFASLGIPTGMVFVRNGCGSHNPDEAMSLEDFAVGARALQHVLTHFPIR